MWSLFKKRGLEILFSSSEDICVLYILDASPQVTFIKSSRRVISSALFFSVIDHTSRPRQKTPSPAPISQESQEKCEECSAAVSIHHCITHLLFLAPSDHISQLFVQHATLWSILSAVQKPRPSTDKGRMDSLRLPLFALGLPSRKQKHTTKQYFNSLVLAVILGQMSTVGNIFCCALQLGQ